MHDVELVTDNDAFGHLSFPGSNDSYIHINNSDLAFSAEGQALSWMMYVEPANDKERSTLVRYETENGRVQLHWELLPDKTMQCSMTANDQTVFTVKSLMQIIGKKFVGINFNFMWLDHFDFFHVYTDENGAQKREDERLLEISSQIILELQDAEHIFIGSGFNGNISCIQFYNMSVINSPQKNAPLLCNPVYAYSSTYGMCHFEYLCF